MKFKNSIHKGFTLIELLIVIVIIGILAVAVLSAINPVEQINKAKDAQMRSDANELLNAYERYYTTHGYYPWGEPGGNGCAVPSESAAGTGSCVQVLVDSGELKQEFTERDSVQAQTADNADDLLYVTVDTDNLVHICFKPKSKALQQSDNLKQKNGESPSAGTTGEYVCVPE